MLLIGTDEAGYGPNLGPLTVAGTLWKTTSDNEDLYELFSPVVTRANANSKQIQIADSKQVYQASGSIEPLETTVLAILKSVSCRIPATVEELCQLCCPSLTWTEVHRQAGFDFDQLSLPVLACKEQIDSDALRFQGVLDRASVQLLSVQCQPVFPRSFNDQLDDLGNKAHILSGTTLQLARRLMTLDESAQEAIKIICDKHGGRSKYAALIQHWLTDSMVLVQRESAKISEYRFNEHDVDVSIEFRVGGESFLPTALASMVAKYFREIFMMAWNRFWEVHVPDIKPTKGYPVDARRFKRQIDNVQQKLNIVDDAIWRRK